ncbi:MULTISPECIES: sodium:solute symporter family transporter [Sphingomonas]|jgi:Na+/proline symporter|uniref:Sodium:solute symporter n=1 Tax=Sphingomonas adhaesiva TaxID=28212 RepID=A0A2A4IAU0_9SPHN|nr:MULTISPECIES: sodium:solute symporter [Sphingomonas]PCG16077.1 sodium:solute symporter [Sphingomonas adhaesiva]PZU79747.1 MAG: sodium:solute symporter [Sphingomonas sp.]
MSLPFSIADWVVIAAYVLLLLAGGWIFTPRNTGTATAHDYFLAGGNVPAWLAAISVLSATQSAATFLGGPDYGYHGDLTYLGSNLGGLLGAMFVAHVMIPRFYAIRATTAYELLTLRFSATATRWAGGMFLIGRVFAGGARVYLAAIALAMVITGTVEAQGIMIAAALLIVASVLFTFVGGLKSVLWNDLIQFVVYLGSAIAVVVFLRWSIPATTGQIIDGLIHTPEGVNKLRLFDLSTDLSRPFSLLAVVTGVTLLYIANAGMDQDTTQRLLACKDAKTGARGLYLSVLATVPVVGMFILIGLLLYVFYDRPDLMGGTTAAAGRSFGGEKISIFMHYILTQLPGGLRGLVTVGICAAAVATTNSALNAMSSVLVQDFYRPWRERRGAPAAEHHYVQAGRAGMGVIGIAMFAMAVASFYWQRYSEMGLLEFALQVMVFTYAGLLGVYFTALFTARGTTASVVAALIAGFAVVLLLQPAIARAIGLPGALAALSFPFQLCIGTAIAFAICAAPRGTASASRPMQRA